LHIRLHTWTFPIVLYLMHSRRGPSSLFLILCLFCDEILNTLGLVHCTSHIRVHIYTVRLYVIFHYVVYLLLTYDGFGASSQIFSGFLAVFPYFYKACFSHLSYMYGSKAPSP